MTNLGDLIPLRRFHHREEAEWERGHLHHAGIVALLVIRSEEPPPEDRLPENGPYELVVPLVDAARAVAVLDRERAPPPAPEEELGLEVAGP
jgi:hypothetical protein